MITRGVVVGREISGRYLSENERVQIADLRAAGDRGPDGSQPVHHQPRAAA